MKKFNALERRYYATKQWTDKEKRSLLEGYKKLNQHEKPF